MAAMNFVLLFLVTLTFSACSYSASDPTPTIPGTVEAEMGKRLASGQTAIRSSTSLSGPMTAQAPTPKSSHTDIMRSPEKPLTVVEPQLQGPVDTVNSVSPHQHPEWVELFTTNPTVLSYRWYIGNDCPTDGYSFRDDLYVLPAEEVLSPLELQERGEENTLIGTGGLHSADGYICMALSEDIHPSNLTALHELAHAIVYVEHGLTGHNKIHDDKVIELALKFDESDCPTEDASLINLIAWHKPLFQRYPLPTKDYANDPLFNFCYGGITQPAATPTSPPTPTPTTTFIHTPAPTLQFKDNGSVGRYTSVGIAGEQQGTAEGHEGLKWEFTVASNPAGESDQDIVIEVSLKNSLVNPSITETYYLMLSEDGDFLIFASNTNDSNTFPLVHILRIVDGQPREQKALAPPALTPRTHSAGARHLESIRVQIQPRNYSNEDSRYIWRQSSEWTAPLVFEFPGDYPTE